MEAEDPFGLFGEVSRRAVSTKRRRAFAGEGQEGGNAAQTMPLYEPQHAPANRANSGKNKAARETFYVMSPKQRETRVEKYSGENAELFEEDEKRNQADRDLKRKATLTFHKDKRSRSRASNSANRAAREMKTQQTWIEENKQNIAAYNSGVEAIRSAALEVNGGAEPTGEGVDFMRKKIA